MTVVSDKTWRFVCGCRYLHNVQELSHLSDLLEPHERIAAEYCRVMILINSCLESQDRLVHSTCTIIWDGGAELPQVRLNGSCGVHWYAVLGKYTCSELYHSDPISLRETYNAINVFLSYAVCKYFGMFYSYITVSIRHKAPMLTAYCSRQQKRSKVSVILA